MKAKYYVIEHKSGTVSQIAEDLPQKEVFAKLHMHKNIIVKLFNVATWGDKECRGISTHRWINQSRMFPKAY
jgi:hypothetical protein